MSADAPKIVFANANLDPRVGGIHGPAYVGEFAREAGFDGVEWHPIYWPAAVVGSAVARGDLPLTSLHQSFRTNKSTAGVNQEPSEGTPGLAERVIDSPTGRLLMPEMSASARYMGKLQRIIGRRLPGVYYPQADRQADSLALQEGQPWPALFQPTDHAARLLLPESFQRNLPEKVVAVSSLARVAVGRGYGQREVVEGVPRGNTTPFCFDTFHGQRWYGRGKPGLVSNLDLTLGALAANSYAMHVSLGRSDFADAEPHIPTDQDLRDALKGNFRGRLSEIFDTFREQGNLHYAVVEATTRDVARITGHKKLGDLRKDYSRIASAVRQRLGLAA